MSQLAKLNTLKAPIEGSMVRFSLNLTGHEITVLTSLKNPPPTGPGGGGASQGFTACKACKSAVAKYPLVTKAWAAGVSVPATWVFHWLMALFKEETEMLRPNCPA